MTYVPKRIHRKGDMSTETHHVWPLSRPKAWPGNLVTLRGSDSSDAASSEGWDILWEETSPLSSSIIVSERLEAGGGFAQLYISTWHHLFVFCFLGGGFLSSQHIVHDSSHSSSCILLHLKCRRRPRALVELGLVFLNYCQRQTCTCILNTCGK